MRNSILLAASLAILWACGGPPVPGSTDQKAFRPINPNVATVWDRQTTETAELLGGIVDDFNASNDGLDVKLVHSGNYSDIYRKVTTAIQARALPAMAVAYETMTSEYVRKGAVAELDPLIAHPAVGFSEHELADFFPVLLETNRYPEFSGKTYSFPFTKSVLMLYTNRRMLRDAGIETPPRTWVAFLDHCRRIKRATGHTPLSLDISASVYVGFVYSFGGDVMVGRKPLFDSPESIQAFQLFQTMVDEGLVYQNPPGTFEDQTSFGQDRVAFNFRPSSSLFYVARMMEDYDDWAVNVIPHGDSAAPATVLFGANVCIFDTTPAQKEAAWRFIRFFTSPEITARWAMGTGYLPVRKSAAQSPAMQEFFAEHPHHRVPFDALPHARPEPNLVVWQELRGMIENAMTAVLAQMKSGEDAARELQRDAVALMERRSG